MVQHSKVCVVIKALNEEEHIARSIESSLEAIRNIGGEVILADSGSTDRTTEIASKYPILVVQLANRNERCLGIGPQLGYQYCTCEFLYLLDGDMELLPGFLEVAITEMAKDPSLAGVAGLVTELGGGNYEFESRKALGDGLVVGEMDWLDMGGLYRVDAIKKIGYFSNRNLHLYEEKETGTNLRKLGFHLKRINVPGFIHQGETDTTYKLMFRRWRSRYHDGAGEWLRISIKSGTLRYAVPMFMPRFLMIFGWTLLLAGIFQLFIYTQMHVIYLSLLYYILLFASLWYTKSTPSKILYSFINLQLMGIGLIRGFFRKQVDPCTHVDAVIISDKRGK